MTPRDTSGTGTSAAHGTRAVPPVDASMSLLNEVIFRPVDAGYAEAAARPAVARSAGQRRLRATVNLVVAVLLGVVTMSAVLALRAPRPSVVESRTLLEEQITERSADADTLQQSNEELSAEIARRQEEALVGKDPALFDELRQLELLSGSVAVEGPGLVIELDDAEPSDPDEIDPRTLVQDIDLQIITNGLWAAGAEAIAVNGQRLTALSAIRRQGPAILVDLAPLVAPYTVEAVGDVQAMQTAFARSVAANHLTTLTANYRIPTSLRSATSLTLQGSGTTTLRYASVPDDDVASSGATDDEGTS